MPDNGPGKINKWLIARTPPERIEGTVWDLIGWLIGAFIVSLLAFYLFVK